MTTGVWEKKKGEGGRACKHCLKTSIRPLEKKKTVYVEMSNVSMFGIELLAQVSRGRADLHTQSVLCSSAIVPVSAASGIASSAEVSEYTRT